MFTVSRMSGRVMHPSPLPSPGGRGEGRLDARSPLVQPSPDRRGQEEDEAVRARCPSLLSSPDRRGEGWLDARLPSVESSSGERGDDTLDARSPSVQPSPRGRGQGEGETASCLAEVRRALRAKAAGVAAALCLAGSFLAVAPAWSADIEPRAYSNAPVGINFLIAGYAYSDGGLSTDPASPIQDARLQINTGLVAYARTLSLWGKSGKFDVTLPYSDLSGTALVNGNPAERQVTGFNDPRFRVSVNFIGAPALSKQEFASYRQDLIVGGSLQVAAPLGQYDPDRLVNIGTNRWFFKPEVGISKALGAFTLEFSTAVYFYTTNDDYFGGKTLEQDPVSSTQAHVIYSFGRGVWAALHGTYDYGGRTTIDGVRDDEVMGNSRLGATLALPVNRNNSIKLYASTGTATRTGSDYDLAGIAWQYRW